MSITARAICPRDAQMIGQMALAADCAQRRRRRARGRRRRRPITAGRACSRPAGCRLTTCSAASPLGEAVATAFQLIRGASDVRFPLDFALTMPADLPPGLYVPIFTGYYADCGRRAHAPGIRPARRPRGCRWSSTSAASRTSACSGRCSPTIPATAAGAFCPTKIELRGALQPRALQQPDLHPAAVPARHARPDRLSAGTVSARRTAQQLHNRQRAADPVPVPRRSA